MARPQDVRIRFLGEDKTGRAFATVGRNAERLRQQTQTSNEGLVGFGRSLASVARVAGGIFALRGFVSLAGDIVSADSSLNVLLSRLQAVGGTDITINDVANQANKLGISLQSAGDNIARFLLAGRRLDLTNDQVLTLTENLGALGRIGGGTTQEITSGIVQFGQALAKGKPDAVELRSIITGLPLVAEELARTLGVGVGDLAALNSEGKITSEVLAQAVLNAQNLDERFASVALSVEQVQARLSNSVDQLFAATNLSKVWIGILKNVDDSVNNIRIQFFGADSEIEKVTNRIETLQDRLTRQRPGEPVFQRTTAEIQALEAQLQRLSGPGGSTARTPGTAAGIGAPTTGEEIQALNKLTRKDEEKKMVEQNDEMLTIMRERLGTATAS